MSTFIDHSDNDTEIFGIQFDGIDENRAVRNVLEQSGEILGEVGVSPQSGRLIFNTEDGPVLVRKDEWLLRDRTDGWTVWTPAAVEAAFEVKADA